MKQLVSKSTFKAKAANAGKALVPRDHDKPADMLHSLRGSVLRYDDPLKPVGVEDWKALR
jgi:hypothetical protein